MESQLVETWRMSNEANLYLTDNIPEEYLEDGYASGTRTVSEQFAHMHNVRLQWLSHAAAELVHELEGFPRGAQPTKKVLKEALIASEDPVAQFLQKSETTGKAAGWQGSPTAVLGYLVAHEAHHRGLAMVALRISGHKLPNEIVYGQWDWGKKRSMR